MYLAHYWAVGGTWRFNPESGTMIWAPFVSRDKLDWGFVWRQGIRRFAVWKDDSSLIFQHRQNKWRLTSEIEIRLLRGARRRFTIVQDKTKAFDLKYRFGGLLWSGINPTYDALDEESDDFFLFVFNLWSSWKNRPVHEFISVEEYRKLNP
jgi:hypothetical protein